MTFPDVLSIRSRLTNDEAALRQAVLQRLASLSLPSLAASPPPMTWAEAAAALGWPAEHAAAVGAALAAKKLAGLDAAGRVRYVYPVSIAPTPHQVTLADGRTLYAMCAIDSLGCAWTFNQPVQVEASCHVCGEPVHVTVRGPAQPAAPVESQPPGAYATHVDLNKYDDWAANTWMVMNFFCTKNHLDEWYVAAGADPDTYALSLPEALEVSRLLFGE